MLMSEQDYADIGLPKEPRVKLLNSMRQLRTNGNHSPTPQQQAPQQQQHQSPLLKPINPQPPSAQPLWNSMEHAVLPNNLQHPESRLPPGLRSSVPFHTPPHLAVRYLIHRTKLTKNAYGGGCFSNQAKRV